MRLQRRIHSGFLGDANDPMRAPGRSKCDDLQRALVGATGQTYRLIAAIMQLKPISTSFQRETGKSIFAPNS